MTSSDSQQTNCRNKRKENVLHTMKRLNKQIETENIDHIMSTYKASHRKAFCVFVS